MKPLHLRGLSLGLLLASPAFAQVCLTPEPDAGAPWPAVVLVSAVAVRDSRDAGALPLGQLQRGAVVLVQGCLPDCSTRGAWARLERGGVPLSVLRPATPQEEDAGVPEYWYGAVRDAGTVVWSRPTDTAEALSEEGPPRTLALLPNTPLARSGWLELHAGGFVHTTDVWLARPSTFEGEHTPTLPLGFVFRRTARTLPVDLEGPPEPLLPFVRFPVASATADAVEVDGGTLPRAAVRLVFPAERPPEIPPDARWVHIDLTEQSLTAYEGDTPVFATLVSTGVWGAHSERTLPGTYRVWFKTLHDAMHGEGYSVDEVPWTMFFHGGQALHGVTWHEQFGQSRTHGCVNLSVADARWLFEWAPPRLPRGWHSLAWREGDAEPSLWVVVAEPPRGRLWP